MRFHEAMQYLENGYRVRATNWFPPECYISRANITAAGSHSALLNWNAEWELAEIHGKKKSEADVLIESLKEIVNQYEQREANGHSKN